MPKRRHGITSHFERSVRQRVQRRAHFSFNSLVVMDDHQDKRAKTHEAQLIPGVDGHRIFWVSQ